MSKDKSVLITGATGCMGRRLAAALVETGRPLRSLVRDPARIPSSLGSGCQVVRGDLLDQRPFRAALADVSAAYYLVQSMGAAGRFAERDREGEWGRREGTLARHRELWL